MEWRGFIIENDGQKKAYFLPETVYEDDELSEMADQIKKQFICTTESMKVWTFEILSLTILLKISICLFEVCESR